MEDSGRVPDPREEVERRRKDAWRALEERGGIRDALDPALECIGGRAEGRLASEGGLGIRQILTRRCTLERCGMCVVSWCEREQATPLVVGSRAEELVQALILGAAQQSFGGRPRRLERERVSHVESKSRREGRERGGRPHYVGRRASMVVCGHGARPGGYVAGCR